MRRERRGEPLGRGARCSSRREPRLLARDPARRSDRSRSARSASRRSAASAAATGAAPAPGARRRAPCGADRAAAARGARRRAPPLARAAARAARSASSRAASAAWTRLGRRVDVGQRGMLRTRRGVHLPDERLAPVALGQHPVLAAGRQLAQLAGARAPTRRPPAVTATPANAAVQPVHRRRRPRRWRAARARGAPRAFGRDGDASASRVAAAVRVAGAARRPPRRPRCGAALRRPRRATPAAARRGARAGRLAGRDQRGAAVAARAVEQPLGLGEVAGHRGAQARAERRGQRQLVARLGAQRVRQRGRAARGSGLGAQELVDLRELGASRAASRRAASAVRSQLAAGGARRLRGPVGLAARGASALGRLAQALGLGRRGRAPRLELVELPGELLRAVLRPAAPAPPRGRRRAPRPRRRRRRPRRRRRARSAAPARRPARSASVAIARRALSSRSPIRSCAERVAWKRPASRSRSSLRAASARSAASRRVATVASSASVAAAAARAAVAAASAPCSAAPVARALSRASVQRASSLWRSSRACSSAASAWRLSGRSRVRASRSTSSARSRLSCVRSSLSCARRRRRRCLPRPAASSISSRRSRGRDVTISATRPCDTIECISRPSPVSDSSSSTSDSRQRAPLTRYSPSPARLSRRTIEISDSGRSIAPSPLSSSTSTSASERACTPWAPAKITSCIDWPRTASGDCSPSAHRTASVTLDLPEPLGPTITDTPGANSSRVRSGKDLKPLSTIVLRCTSGLLRLPALRPPPPAPRPSWSGRSRA